MKLKATPIEIPPEEPFKNDLLSRKTCAEQLTEIVKSYDEPLVLCINAAWGNGKTIFIKMWREHLKCEGFKTLYFNAWENDHSDDALVSLIGELSAGMDELNLKGKTAQKANAYLNKAKKISVGLIKKGIPLAIRIGTSGIIDVADIKAAQDAASKISEVAEEVAKEQIERYDNSKKTISGFREQLKSFAEEVTAPEEGNERRPLVIMVDELDRCRPPYAVQVLEKIKHLFNVPNIIFVITVDKEQLAHSIESMYGQGMNVDGYLRRFIDLDFNLPASEPGVFAGAQFARFGLADFFEQRKGDLIRYDREQLAKAFTTFFTGFGLSLREQEHCFSLLSLAIRSTPSNYQIFPFLLSTLIVLKIKNNQLYSEFVTGKVGYKEILQYIGSTVTGQEFLKDNYGTALEIQLAVCQSQSASLRELLAQNEQQASNAALSDAERKRASQIVDLVKYYSMNFGGLERCLGYLVQKIDLVSRSEK